MARKSTGKRLRFEIFKRDHFTCQYCGAQPPDVVLVVDHMTPVATGGLTEATNLITACEACNQGKAGIPLSEVPVRPDADLLYLQTQQEIAELRRYQESKAERDEVLAEIIRSLQAAWAENAGTDWHPVDRIVRQLLSRYSPEIVDRAMEDVALKVGGDYFRGRDRDAWVPYLYRVAQTFAREFEGETD
jgi:hypothetical protein